MEGRFIEYTRHAYTKMSSMYCVSFVRKRKYQYLSISKCIFENKKKKKKKKKKNKIVYLELSTYSLSS